LKAAIFVRVSNNRQDYQRQISDLEKEAAKQSLVLVEIIK